MKNGVSMILVFGLVYWAVAYVIAGLQLLAWMGMRRGTAKEQLQDAGWRRVLFVFMVNSTIAVLVMGLGFLAPGMPTPPTLAVYVVLPVCVLLLVLLKYAYDEMGVRFQLKPR